MLSERTESAELYRNVYSRQSHTHTLHEETGWKSCKTRYMRANDNHVRLLMAQQHRDGECVELSLSLSPSMCMLLRLLRIALNASIVITFNTCRALCAAQHAPKNPSANTQTQTNTGKTESQSDVGSSMCALGNSQTLTCNAHVTKSGRMGVGSCASNFEIIRRKCPRRCERMD